MRPTLEDIASALEQGAIALHHQAHIIGKGPVAALLRICADRFSARSTAVRARIQRSRGAFEELLREPLFNEVEENTEAATQLYGAETLTKPSTK